MIPAIVLFAITYVLILVFSKYRTYIALLSGLVFIVTGMLPLSRVMGAIDFNVILMIVGTMGLVSLFTESKMPAKLADMVRYTEEEVCALCDTLTVFAAYFENSTQLLPNEKTIGQMVKSYIVQNLSKKITLSELSLHTHCSTVTLTEHFKDEYGITIMDYVMKKRMEKARRLLANSELSIREVAEECGFSDNEYFSRCFKEWHGAAPTVWKKKQKSDNIGEK
jgi:AraC-like DNA-binding protein